MKKKQHGVSWVFMNSIFKTQLHVDFGKQMSLRFENCIFMSTGRQREIWTLYKVEVGISRIVSLLKPLKVHQF